MPVCRSILVHPTERGRRGLLLVAALVTALAAMAIAARPASAAANICTGTPSAPGVLAGDYAGNVIVRGACAVNAGPATVHGDLRLASGAVVIAAFGQKQSRLAVTGSVIVEPGATLLLGCLPRSFPCLDDPSHEHPTLSSHGSIGGRLIERDPLGVIVHDSAIGGSVSESGGGGGVNCTPMGVFALFGSPVYSDYEDSTIGGDFTISMLHSCWLGVARDHIGGTARFRGNQFADRDAIEIIDNHIAGNLSCFGNSMVWDSAELATTGALFPRQLERNTVGGERVGQCVLASPMSEGGPLGPGPF